jgi:hypothetical protein
MKSQNGKANRPSSEARTKKRQVGAPLSNAAVQQLLHPEVDNSNDAMIELEGRTGKIKKNAPTERSPGLKEERKDVDHVTDKQAVEALNRAADDLLEVAGRAARAAIQRGDEIDATLAQIRMLRANPVVLQNGSSQKLLKNVP